MSDIYHTLSRTLACRNSRFDVYFDELEFSNGTVLPDFLAVRPRVQDAQGVAGVLILPVVEGKIGLMRGYRHQFSCQIWQGPAGFMELGESALTAAARELTEETGLICSIEDVVSLGTVCPDAGLIEGRVALFFANCSGILSAQTIDNEIGTGKLEYFSVPEFERFLQCEENIGGATLAAGYRCLSVLKLKDTAMILGKT